MQQHHTRITDFSIPGSGGQPILGNTHLPTENPRGIVLIAHGFKGYKDYGMFPRIAQHFAAHGFIAHRFNFSHSGMTSNITTFERPDLFERDTWNKQVEDLRLLLLAIEQQDLPGSGSNSGNGTSLPVILFGHSRGGVAVLLAVGRGGLALPIAGIITAAAPATCLSMSDDQQQQLLADGFLISPSGRTGQDLRVGSGFLQEQLDDPAGHDLLKLARNITCPVLIIHGTDDPTVPVSSAAAIASAIGENARVIEIASADHVFNTPNPLPVDQPASPQLQQLLDESAAFAESVCTSP